MTRKKLALIHTSATLIPVFETLCSELLPKVDLVSLADESLINDVIAYSAVSPSVTSRLSQHVRDAEHAGADLIMVTCSSLGQAVETSRQNATIPVLRVDQAMAEEAVKSADRVGVIATLSTTLNPTVSLLQQCAATAGRTIEVQAALCDGAFEALIRGDVETHDQLVLEQLKKLIQSVDEIVLAQASMARVAQQMPPEAVTIPILSSPRLAIESLQQRFH